jgi:predicted aspartyl protease
MLLSSWLLRTPSFAKVTFGGSDLVNLRGNAMYWKHISCLGYIFGVIASAAAQDWINQGAVGLPAIVGTAAAATDNEVRLEKQGGTYALPVQINRAITLKFILDSGASDVLIPADVFLTLLRTGTVSESDFLGSQTYSLADGSKLKGTRFIIRELRVGNQVATDVVASVGPVSGDLLLGLSFLSKFGAVTLDNDRHVLILSAGVSIQPRVERQRDEEATVKVPASPDYLAALSAGEAAYNQRDYSTAVSMLQPAAHAGDGLAQYYLGVMTLKGQGVPKNPQLAVEWLSKAATAGYADAQAYMGAFNRRGDLVPKNYPEALRWYMLAAKQNHENSQYRIALMYYTGEGVGQDFREAYMWAVIASAGGEPEPNRLRMKLEQMLSASDITDVQRTAALWRSENILPR